MLKATTDLQTALLGKLHLVERKLLEETLNMGKFRVFLAGTEMSIVSKKQEHNLELSHLIAAAYYAKYDV
jgi:hypothetical protein